MPQTRHINTTFRKQEAFLVLMLRVCYSGESNKKYSWENVRENVVKNLYDPDTKGVTVNVKSWEVRIDITSSAASDP